MFALNQLTSLNKEEWVFNAIFEQYSRKSVKQHQVAYDAIWRKECHLALKSVQNLGKTIETCMLSRPFKKKGIQCLFPQSESE